MTAAETLQQPCRDLAADELWRRSLTRSRERRAIAAAGEHAPRSLVSLGMVDLDGPAYDRSVRGGSERDLSEEGIWALSLACAQAKRRAADKGLLPQARVASASLLVAAVAGLMPTLGGAHPRASSAGASQVDDRLLRMRSQGPAVKAVQRALGISVDGIYGPQTRAAVRAFQAKHGLVADGIVGPKTRRVLFGRGDRAAAFIRAWWVVPVQKALRVQVDGLYGPQSRAAVRAFQARKGLVVDGIVGPKTLAALGIRRGKQQHHHGGGGGNAAPSGAAGPASVTRSLWDELAIAKRQGLRLISGHRPGALISAGKPSDHSYYPSRAIDVAGSRQAMRAYARTIAGRARIRYIIYSPLGLWGNWNGAWRPVTGGTRAAHYDHVHVSASR